MPPTEDAVIEECETKERSSLFPVCFMDELFKEQTNPWLLNKRWLIKNFKTNYLVLFNLRSTYKVILMISLKG